MSKTIQVENMNEKRQDTVEAFRLLADTIPTICWMADAKGNIYWYNKRWYDYTGYNPGKMRIQDWQAAHDSSDHAHILEKWKQANKTGEPFDMVVSLKGVDGVYRPFLSHIVPSKDDDGNVNGWLGIKNDISELQAANKALKASEEKFMTLAEAMPQMAFMADAKGNITYYNKQWYEYVNGIKDTEGWGWKDKQIHHPDDLQRTIDKWNNSLKTGEDYEIEYRLRRFDGTYRWHLGRAVAVRDSKGAITSWIGTNTDIHEQKHQSQYQNFLLEASGILSESLDYKKTLRTIAELCVPALADWCSVDVLGSDGEIEQVAVAHTDPGKVELAKEFRKRNPVSSMDTSAGVAKVISTGEPEFYPDINHTFLEASIEDPDTLQFMKGLNIHSIIIVPISMKNKPIGAITFVASDAGGYYTENDLVVIEELAGRVSLAITNAMLFGDIQVELDHSQKLEKELTKEKETLESRVRRRTEQLERTNEGLRSEIERRREAEAELHRSNQELQDFAYVASHDLQEPLRKIQAFGDILENEYGQQLGDGSEYLKRMHSAATRMSQLIEDLLMFSRVTSKPPAPKRVDLGEVVSEVISDLENRISQAKGSVEVGNLPKVMADPTHMRQLFQNLIANALKFHRDAVPPVVKITSEAPASKDGFCLITVEDNGIGFDEKYTDRIFGVFQRLHGRGSYEGTGIGLAVCRKIVERYGGTITAEGQAGKGSKFIIKLPTTPVGDKKQ